MFNAITFNTFWMRLEEWLYNIIVDCVGTHVYTVNKVGYHLSSLVYLVGFALQETSGTKIFIWIGFHSILFHVNKNKYEITWCRDVDGMKMSKSKRSWCLLPSVSRSFIPSLVELNSGSSFSLNLLDHVTSLADDHTHSCSGHKYLEKPLHY